MSGLRAGDFDYDCLGSGYARVRRADLRIAAAVHDALGDARTIVNVGAGAGSYEPADRHVVAVEPSAAMRAQRPAHLAPAVIGRAESLPFDDGAFDAAMATITVHQWSDLERGLAELRRVARGPVAILTFDGALLDRFWLSAYAPELVAVERRRYPAIGRIRGGLGGTSEVARVPIPLDCNDGFGEAFYGRPERLLDPEVRAAQSAWSFLDEAVHLRIVRSLEADLRSGAWDRAHGALRAQPTFEGSLTLVVARPA